MLKKIAFFDTLVTGCTRGLSFVPNKKDFYATLYIEYSSALDTQARAHELMQVVFNTACAAELFQPKDIKTRVYCCTLFSVCRAI